VSKIILPLSRSYEGHDGPFSSIELREPTYADIFIDGLGEPQQWQPGPAGGQPVLITLPDVINAYVDRLAIKPTAENLTGLNARDSLALAAKVKGFFMVEPEQKTSQTSSFFGSDGMPAVSAE
jgi:hypothetical protein